MDEHLFEVGKAGDSSSVHRSMPILAYPGASIAFVVTFLGYTEVEIATSLENNVWELVAEVYGTSNTCLDKEREVY